MKKLLCAILAVYFLMITGIVQGQGPPKARVVFDEAKKVTGSLSGAMRKIAKVNGKRIYSGDTVYVGRNKISFEVRVDYLGLIDNPAHLDIKDDVPTYKDIKVSAMKYVEEMVQVEHYVQARPKDAFDKGKIDYWIFIFIVERRQ